VFACDVKSSGALISGWTSGYCNGANETTLEEIVSLGLISKEVILYDVSLPFLGTNKEDVEKSLLAIVVGYFILAS